MLKKKHRSGALSLKEITIVDDDQQLRTVLREILEDAGYIVSEADSGTQCLELLKKTKPDLILLDVMMPDMDGWETCRKIKENRETRDLTVAMLTVKSQDKDKLKSLGYGAADWHISKPINKKDFLKTVRWILKET
jgi:CheY-like chemotaxis protein